MLTETIVAISTGGVNSSINIIRISGEESLNIIKNIFTNYNKIEHQKIIYGKILNSDKEIIDEVLVSYFKGPKSFTGEDIIEINCHGGKENTILILKEVLKNGARIAEPGEFSKRAYINGKMDLSKAEAIIDIINAKTSAQVKIASGIIDGKIRDNILLLKNKLIDIMAQIEVSIDYPEYDYEEISNEELNNKLNIIKNDIDNILKESTQGKFVKDGVRIAILGKTNSGKSSLLNKLLNEEKAIVTDIEGTTRDIVEDTIIINNLAINIVDTAGIRKTDDIVENIGIERSLNEIERADGIIYLLDKTKNMDDEDINNIEKIRKTDKPLFICYNKVDISRENNVNNDDESICISTKTGEGIDILKEKIIEKFETINIENIQDKIIVNQRQQDLLERAKNNIEEALNKIMVNEDIDIIEINIKEASYYLGEIIGDNASSDVINRIFEKFCLGK